MLLVSIGVSLSIPPFWSEWGCSWLESSEIVMIVIPAKQHSIAKIWNNDSLSPSHTHARKPDMNGVTFDMLWKIVSGTKWSTFVTSMKAMAPEKHLTIRIAINSFGTAESGFCLWSEQRATAPIKVVDVLKKLISHTVTFRSLSYTSLSKACIV